MPASAGFFLPAKKQVSLRIVQTQTLADTQRLFLVGRVPICRSRVGKRPGHLFTGSRYQCLGQYMYAVLGDRAGGFQCRHDAEPALTHMRADALQAASGKIDLNRLAHLQQYTRDINLMPGRQACLSQLHDHQRVSTLIVFHPALSDLHGRLHGLARLGRQRLYLDRKSVV